MNINQLIQQHCQYNTKLTLVRFPSIGDYTEGKLYIDDQFFCDTLENKDRGLNQEMSELEIKKRKIYGQTCIPSGQYKVILSMSGKFKRVLPEILNVKGFSGIRMHRGNTSKDTLGCILVGEKCGNGVITKSTVTEQSLINKLTNKTIVITIKYADYGKKN